MRIRAALWTAALALVPAFLAVSAAATPPDDTSGGVKGALYQAAKDANQAERDAYRFAQSTGQDVKKDLKQAGQDVKKDLKQAGQDAKKDLKQAGEDAKKAADAAAKEMSKQFHEWQDKLRQTRDDRKAQQRKDIKDRYGTLLNQPAVRDELRAHSRRMARLNYIEKLADDIDFDTIEDRAEKARELEKDRHDRRMSALLRSGGVQ